MHSNESWLSKKVLLAQVQRPTAVMFLVAGQVRQLNPFEQDAQK
jgi:hypothetical protein